MWEYVNYNLAGGSLEAVPQSHHFLAKEGHVLVALVCLSVCLFVCLLVSNITQNVVNGLQ